MCLPEPYCSYMIEGAFVDANPTKSCSHTMLNEYGCCTLPCSSTNAIPVRSAQAESSAGDDFRSSTVPSTKRPVTTSTFTEPAASTVPPLFSPAIALSPTDFPTCGHANPAFKDVVRNGPRESQLAPTGKWCWQVIQTLQALCSSGKLINFSGFVRRLLACFAVFSPLLHLSTRLSGCRSIANQSSPAEKPPVSFGAVT